MATEIDSAHALPRCYRYDAVIGVYDPLVHVTGGMARRTSRAAEPDTVTVAGNIYHSEGYELAVGGE